MATSKNRDTKSSDNHEEAAIEEKNDCRFHLKPMLVLMALGGCYSSQIHRRYILSTVICIYKGLLALVMLLYTLRTLALLREPLLVISAIMNLIISFQSLGNMLICWKIFSKKYGNFSGARNQLNKIISDMTTNHIMIDLQNLTKRTKIIVFFSLTTVILGILAQVVVSFVLLPLPGQGRAEFGNLSGVVSTSYSWPFEDSLNTRIALYLALILHLLPYTFPVFCLMSISVVFLTVFKGLNKRLEDLTELDRDKLFTNVETVRKIHADLCSAVQTFDKDLRYLFGNIFFWTILAGIMVLYTVIKYTMPLMVQLTMVYYLALALVMLAAVSISAAMVNEKAHSPLESLYTIDVKEEISLGKVTQLNLFLSRLTGPPVGFTTYGLLTITKEFILTIAGAFLTYFTVLYTL